MTEMYKINGTTLSFEHLIYVDVNGSDITGDGSKNNPFATYTQAESVAVANDAIIFGRGVFELVPKTPNGGDSACGCFFGADKPISVIGEGYDTVIIADAQKYRPCRDQPLFSYNNTDAYRLNIKYNVYGTQNYNNSVFSHGTTVLYNIAIENISATKTMSMNYYNGGTGGSLINCVIKSNGKNVNDYSGKLVEIKDTLFDWDYKNAASITNKLVRTITSDDIESGTATDLANVGVWTGEFAWKKNMCLYLDAQNKIYGTQNSVFTKLNDDWAQLNDADKKALFLSTNYEVATASDLSTLGKFKVLTYGEADDKPTLSLTAVPHDQLIAPNKLIRIESYDGIDKATIASAISGNGACKIIVTTDLTTYQTYDFTAQTWQPIDHTDLAAVKASGIDAATLQTIDRTAWDLLTTGKSGIGFAYFLSIDSTSDTCAVDKLTLQVDMRGSWDKAVHGTDYGYGYPYNTTLRIDLKKNGDYKINYCGGV